MNEKNLVELINKDIDGELNQEEKKILENEISNSPEAAKLYDELNQAAQMLKNDMIDIHAIDVREEVMGKIKDKYAAGYRKSGLWKSMSLFEKNPWVIAFSMGVIAGIIILAVFYSSGIINAPGNEVSGTMSSIETYANFEKADDIIIDINNIKGKISSQFSKEVVIASLDISSEEKLTVNLLFNQTNLHVYSIKPVSVNSESSFASGGGTVLINNVGENKYMIFFKYKGQLSRSDAISIRLLSESGQTAEYSLLTSN